MYIYICIYIYMYIYIYMLIYIYAVANWISLQYPTLPTLIHPCWVRRAVAREHQLQRALTACAGRACAGDAGGCGRWFGTEFSVFFLVNGHITIGKP